MTIIRIRKIIWDKQNTEHIKKHKVTTEEAEIIVRSDVNITEGYSGKRLLTGRAGARLLTVVGKINVNVIYIVTARDASSEERKRYHEFEKNKNR